MDVEINDRDPEKFIPHPVLDDSEKMMRIIANPVYDKLTISRAAHVRRHYPTECVRRSVRVNSTSEKPVLGPIKSLPNEQTIITPLPTNNHQTQRKSVSRRPNCPPFPLLTRSSSHHIPSKNPKLSAQSRKTSIHSSFTDNEKKSTTTTPTDSNTRYVNSKHGLEVQRYSSPNWLTINLLTKDACESEDKTFRDMIDRKEQNDLLSRSIYTSEYYRQRWEDLLASCQEGHLTHDQWARQNYQLNCLKIFYMKALEREQHRIDLYEQNLRQRRVECVFNQWKEGKTERPRSQFNTSNTQRTTEVTSVLSNPTSSIPNNTTNRTSVSSIVENDLEELPLFRPVHFSRNTSILSKTSYMFDEQRWSLKAMLKRVVGLAEPLPPPPKLINTRRYSSLTNVTNDSGFESVH